MADNLKQGRWFGATGILAYAVELVSIAGVAAFLIAVAINGAVFAGWNLNFLQVATISDVIMSGLDIFFAVLGAFAAMAAAVAAGYVARSRLSYPATVMIGVLIAAGTGACLASGSAVYDSIAEMDQRSAAVQADLAASALDDLALLDAAPFLYDELLRDPEAAQDQRFGEELAAALHEARDEWERTGVIPPEVVEQFRPDPDAMLAFSLEISRFNMWAASSVVYNAALLTTALLILFLAPYLVTTAFRLQRAGRRIKASGLHLLIAFQFLIVGYYAFTVFEFRTERFRQEGFVGQEISDGCPRNHDPAVVEEFGEDILTPQQANVMWIGERAMVVRCGSDSIRLRLHEGGVWTDDGPVLN